VTDMGGVPGLSKGKTEPGKCRLGKKNRSRIFNGKYHFELGVGRFSGWQIAASGRTGQDIVKKF